MEVLKWIGIVIIILIIISSVAISCYGMGEDMIRILPLWLTKFLVGTIFFTVTVCIAGIFVLGIVKMRDIIKEG